MREVPKIYIFYSGFVSRGGGVVTHLKVVEKALKRLEPNIVVKAYSLDNLKPFSYLLVVSKDLLICLRSQRDLS